MFALFITLALLTYFVIALAFFRYCYINSRIDYNDDLAGREATFARERGSSYYSLEQIRYTAKSKFLANVWGDVARSLFWIGYCLGLILTLAAIFIGKKFTGLTISRWNEIAITKGENAKTAAEHKAKVKNDFEDALKSDPELYKAYQLVNS